MQQYSHSPVNSPFLGAQVGVDHPGVHKTHKSEVSAATLFNDKTHLTNNTGGFSSSIMSPVSSSIYRIYDVPKPYVPYNVSVRSPTPL